MIAIPYVAPQIPEAEAARSQRLVTEMQNMVTQLTTAGQAPSNRASFLSPTSRARLEALGFRKSLISNAAFFTELVRVLRQGAFVEENQLMVGFTSEAFDSELYASAAIKAGLQRSHKGRCCFCESLIDPSSYGAVEHFRPKAGYTERGSTLFRPGYYTFAYDPTNLLYSCQLCNAFKANSFPVIGARYPNVTLAAESRILVFPYTDNPRNYIRFNPMNARAYEFDLVSRFYSDTQGLGPSQIENLLWQDPSNIPGQVDVNNNAITNPNVDQAFQAWLPTCTDATLQRGRGTISILNLNRPPLIRARANQLLKLRGILAMATNQGSDTAAATQLLNLLTSNNPSAPSLAPEYLSASIDALATWSKGTSGNNGIVRTYCQILEILSRDVPSNNPTPTPHNDSLIYLVLAGDREIGVRRVIYISDADKVYGNITNERGITLAIDWDNDLNNGVVVRRNGRTVRETTLRELVTEPRTLWRTFTNADVWAVGQYLPVNITN